jgi:hypothetical protein
VAAQSASYAGFPPVEPGAGAIVRLHERVTEGIQPLGTSLAYKIPVWMLLPRIDVIVDRLERVDAERGKAGSECRAQHGSAEWTGNGRSR